MINLIAFIIILDGDDKPLFDSFLVYEAKPLSMSPVWDLSHSNLVVPFIWLRKMKRPVRVVVDWSNAEDI
jgi:hypothetical protein